MKVSRAAVATAAACLTVGLAGPAPASAAAKDDSAKAKSSQSARTVNRRLSTTNRRLNTTRRQVATARRNITKITTDLGAVARRLQSAEGGVGLLLGAAPQLINGLTQLGTAVRDQIAPGLQALATAVQTQIAPGLQRVGDFISAPEYGAVRGTIKLPAALGATTSTTPAVVSPDVPDSGNPAVISAANVPINLASSNGNPIPSGLGNAEIGAIGAFRSAEVDGAGNTSQPAGQMGGLLVVTCLSPGTDVCNTGSGGAAGDREPGQLVCTAQTPTSTFPLPTGGTTDQTLRNVLLKNALTDTDAPKAGEADDIIGSTCPVRVGAVYGLTINAQAVDIPTSTSPGPKD